MKLKNFSNSKFIWIVMFSVLLVSLSGFSQNIDADTPMKSKLITKNLHVDKIITQAFWNILPNDTLNINLVNGDLLTNEQHDAVMHAITSMDSIELPDNLVNDDNSDSKSIYYLGWAGAMTEAQKDNTGETIPSNYNIVQSSTGNADIIIQFEKELNSNGFTGYTRTILQDDEIIMSYIKIYDTDNLSISDLTTIVRHEFGHALGLGHSTDVEDLMASNIITSVPYISECNVSDIQNLYDVEFNNTECM